MDLGKADIKDAVARAQNVAKATAKYRAALAALATCAADLSDALHDLGRCRSIVAVEKDLKPQRNSEKVQKEFEEPLTRSIEIHLQNVADRSRAAAKDPSFVPTQTPFNLPSPIRLSHAQPQTEEPGIKNCPLPTKPCVAALRFQIPPRALTSTFRLLSSNARSSSGALPQLKHICRHQRLAAAVVKGRPRAGADVTRGAFVRATT
ncbi:hypothetical protein BDK51DRAFT_44709 [Blyttiomyces helicus]|uniref:Uncharacterized protein n=1 Tax=Blyttiomyces helicus TaxID=388810 RepID=A0A4P9WRI2_9FUNG|nr:hypothetical protein BDK51DRAFT_44709 [Blyttiomyces helicus]|eukprot:RKO93526.1 hypothetical protein BDK51DRAFT_44709 [Blyttiomyces helicus]